MPFVLSGEKIEATVTEQKRGFARARLDNVVGASPRRVPPACPYFARCGGCHYQQASYEHQLEIKREILRETLRRTAKLELACEIEMHPSPPWNYRNRSRLQLRTGPEFTLGYFKAASQELLGIEECPISSALINRGIAAVGLMGRAGKVPDGVYEIEFFANAGDAQLLVELECSAEVRRASVREFAEEFCGAMPEIAGVTAFRETKPGGALSEKLISVGDRHLTYQTQRAAYRVSTGSFFQTNRHLIDELVRIVTEGQSGELALDLYAGAGLFSRALARDIRHIVSVESSQTSAGDLSYNQSSNGDVVQATTEQYLARLEASGRFGKDVVLPHASYKPDLALVDPPRSGLGESAARLLAKLGAPRVTYVSCDPATLGRDLVILLAAGYQVEQAHLVDLFPQTYHIESVLHLRRKTEGSAGDSK